jgi:hypothetical protein
MKTAFALMVLTFFATELAFAKKSCTEEPKSKWMTEEAFKQKATADGYTIRKFKQPGTCYEIYGTDKDGKKVEVYFNPVDGSVVKKK